MTCRCNSNGGRFETAPAYEQELEWLNPEASSSWTTYQRAEDYYGNQTKVRELTDANFWNIFYDRNKVVVVDFWAKWCRPCDDVAKVMVSLANRYSAGPYARLVKFFHIQWDVSVNPKIATRFGFRFLPVIYFYYTSTGRPPTKAAPLLEGSLAGGELGSQFEEKMHNPDEYIQRIGSILRRHGHLPVAGSARNPESGLLGYQDPRACQRLEAEYCFMASRLRNLPREIESKKYDLDSAERWSKSWQCQNLSPRLRKNPKVVKTCQQQIAKVERIRKELEQLERQSADFSQRLSDTLRSWRASCPNNTMPCR